MTFVRSISGSASPSRCMAPQDTLAALQRVFCYAFDEKIESMVPKLDLRQMDETPFELFGLEFTPIRVVHGKGTVYGFRSARRPI